MDNSNERILIAIGDIKEDIGGLRADVRNNDRRLDEIKLLFATARTDAWKAEQRIVSLEHSRTKLKATVAAISVAVSTVVATAAFAFQHFPLK